MTKKLKICLLMPKDFPRFGGFENVVYDLSRELSKTQKVQVVFTRVSGDRPLPPEVQALGLLKEIKIRYIGFFISTLYNMCRFFLYLRSERPDIINAHPAFPGILISLMGAWFFKIPLVITSHGGDIQLMSNYGTRSSTLASLILKYTLSRVDAHIVLTPAMTIEAIKAGSDPEKIQVIPNGIETGNIVFSNLKRQELKERFNISSRDFVVLFMGRLIDLKRPQDLLYGFNAAQFRNAKLIFAGSGEMEAELKALVKEMGLVNQVHFSGFITPQEGKWDLIRLSQVIVIPSLSEGFSLVAIEAMACGKPVIGTSIMALQELIIPGENGILVDIKSPDQIKEALIYLKENPDKRKEMGLNGQRLVKENYHLSKVARMYLDLYYSLVMY